MTLALLVICAAAGIAIHLKIVRPLCAALNIAL
jgi:hypothetical protein